MQMSNMDASNNYDSLIQSSAAVRRTNGGYLDKKALQLQINPHGHTVTSTVSGPVSPTYSTASAGSPTGGNTSPLGTFPIPRKRFSKRFQPRLVFKTGDINISHANIHQRKRRYLADIFTTLIDIKWRYSLLIFTMGFFISWILFAVIWYVIGLAHGDFKQHEEEYRPCVREMHDFTGAFLFSIETQHTIGYGFRHITEECPEAIVLLMLQSVLGVMMQSFLVGVVFAKLSRPKKRAQTLIFSKTAVICQRDGGLCLLYRVGDMRKSHIVEAHTRLLMIRKKVTSEGEVIPLHQYEMNVGFDQGLDRLFLVWPIIVQHKINEASPLYDVSADSLPTSQFELVTILEGIVESTGMTTQARTSYLPNEIIWGERFQRLIHYQKDDGEYKIDYSLFHSTIPVSMSRVSGRELARMQQEGSPMTPIKVNDVIIMDDASPSPSPREDDDETGSGSESAALLKHDSLGNLRVGLSRESSTSTFGQTKEEPV